MSRSVEQSSSVPTRIERVMLLQGVDLFRFCTAREIVRIAEIAQPRWLEAGAVVYRANDPADALYCVVEGRVELRRQQAVGEPAVAGDAFGVREILSGRLRQYEAVAVSPTSALAISAEEFFDLLSDNVEIVKALFRKILQQSEEVLR